MLCWFRLAVTLVSFTAIVVLRRRRIVNHNLDLLIVIAETAAEQIDAAAVNGCLGIRDLEGDVLADLNLQIFRRYVRYPLPIEKGAVAAYR